MSAMDFKKWKELSEGQIFDFLTNPANPTDCTFIVGKTANDLQRIPCHKKILSQCSEVFSAMFNGNYSESDKNSEIRIDDVEPRAFQHFVNHIYLGYPLIDMHLCQMKILLQLFYLSDKYMIRSLSGVCKDILKFKSEVGISILELSDLIQSQQYEALHLDGFQISIKAVFDDFLHPSIYFMSFYKFLIFLDYVSVGFSSKLQHFQMIERYIMINFMSDKENAKCSNTELPYKICIDELLLRMDFESWSIKEFCDVPLKSSIMDAQTKLQILIQLAEQRVPRRLIAKVNVPSE